MKKPYSVILVHKSEFNDQFYETPEMAYKRAGEVLPRDGRKEVYIVKAIALVCPKYEVIPAERHIEDMDD